MELSKFTANCTKSAQFADPCPELCKICAMHANFSMFSIPTAKIVKIHAIRVNFEIFADFTQFTLTGKQPRLQRIQQNLPCIY